MAAGMLVIAHRTCPLHEVENSLAGIRRAAELGADAVEIDVRRTLDGVPVLMHDGTPWRTAARIPIPIRLLPFALVRRLRLRGAGEHIPSLDDALRALAEGSRIAIEVKHASATQAVIDVVRRRGAEPRVMLWSGKERFVRVMSRAAPDVEVALLRDSARTEHELAQFVADAVAWGARAISCWWGALDETFLADAHSRGLRVYSWCTRPDTQAGKLSLDLDGVVTDWPELARATLDAQA